MLTKSRKVEEKYKIHLFESNQGRKMWSQNLRKVDRNRRASQFVQLHPGGTVNCKRLWESQMLSNDFDNLIALRTYWFSLPSKREWPWKISKGFSWNPKSYTQQIRMNPQMEVKPISQTCQFMLQLTWSSTGFTNRSKSRS